MEYYKVIKLGDYVIDDNSIKPCLWLADEYVVDCDDENGQTIAEIRAELDVYEKALAEWKNNRNAKS